MKKEKTHEYCKQRHPSSRVRTIRMTMAVWVYGASAGAFSNTAFLREDIRKCRGTLCTNKHVATGSIGWTML
jgi:hypothetical protein